MRIGHKLTINALVFALGCIWFLHRELYVFHPDLFGL